MRREIRTIEYRCDVCSKVYGEKTEPRTGEVISWLRGKAWQDNGGMNYEAHDICIECGSELFKLYWKLREGHKT